jgi:membrane protein implicated in regulation of membrane protease activity
MKKFAGKMLKNSVQESNIYALSGKTGIVTKIILKDHKGYVKIGGEEWSAVFEQDLEQINEGEKVKIVRVDGNKVVVEKMEAE